MVHGGVIQWLKGQGQAAGAVAITALTLRVLIAKQQQYAVCAT